METDGARSSKRLPFDPGRPQAWRQALEGRGQRPWVLRPVPLARHLVADEQGEALPAVRAEVRAFQGGKVTALYQSEHSRPYP